MKNQIRHRIKFLIILAFIISQTMQAQFYSMQITPKWVKAIDIPEKSLISKNDIQSGYYLTLADYQVNLEENAYFNHEVINVVSYSGITNASQLSISYDTSYQKLQIHHLYIWRKGKKIDRTNALNIKIMNNENNLDQGIYTGQIKAYDILNDIRKDDLIDFAYTLIGNNPIFNNEKYLFIPLETTNPVDLFSFRAIWSKEKDYTYKCVSCDSLISSNNFDSYKQIEIRRENVKSVKFEDHLPTWEIPYKYFTLSSYKSWKDVNKWAQNVFALKEEPILDSVFSEIFTGKETTDEKINKIINYVQDDIRYMGIESGIGSIKPFPPEQVVRQRFGDCKDKSLLLVSLLKKIGVKIAYPALVNVNLKHEIDKYFPSNEIFDHCIVTFNYNDTTYWVDPTIQVQGGEFRDLYNTDYGKALIIGMPADSLQRMSPRKTGTDTKIIEEFTCNSFNEPAKLKILVNQFGSDADNRRILSEYYSSDDISEQVSAQLKLLYPVVKKTSEMDISDDIENNKYSATYHYEVDGFWIDGDKGTNATSKGLWLFRYEPLTLYQYLAVSSCEDRRSDFEVNYPMNLNYRVVFHFPKDLLIDDDYDTFENEGFYYEEKVEQLSHNSFQIDYNLNTKTNCIKPDDYKKMCEQKNAIVKGAPVVIYFLK